MIIDEDNGDAVMVNLTLCTSAWDVINTFENSNVQQKRIFIKMDDYLER